MKNIRTLCLTTLLAAATIVSCQKLEEMNNNPNQITLGETAPSSLLQNLLYDGNWTLQYRSWRINGDLMQYYHEDDSVRSKVVSAVPSVEICGNKLCGCLTVELKETLLDDEQTVLCNYISGQYSDGWGEGFEQRDIRVDDGMLAVHFWQEDGFKMTLSFEKIPKPEKNFLRPKMQLIGQDGNIFAIMGRASRLLKSSGQGDKAKEMRDRVMSCDSYQKALSIVSEYVETELSPSPTPKRDRGDAR